MAEDLTVNVVGRALQWLRTKAESCLTAVNQVLCCPSTSELLEELNSIQESASQPSVVTIIYISDSTLNNCSFTNQDSSQTAPDLLQMLPELLINGQCRSVHITHSDLHYSMFGNNNVMAVDLKSCIDLLRLVVRCYKDDRRCLLEKMDCVVCLGSCRETLHHLHHHHHITHPLVHFSLYKTVQHSIRQSGC